MCSCLTAACEVLEAVLPAVLVTVGDTEVSVCEAAAVAVCESRCVVDDQHRASMYTVLDWTVVITSLPAPGAPESVRE
jgi:hypothetical protein